MSEIDNAAAKADRSVATLFYRERRLFTLLILMVVALGAAAASSIGRQEDPTITNLFGTIIAPYPGAAPARVEALVTEPIEEELREIPELKEISSTSSTGVASIRIEISEFVPDDRLEQIWSEVRDALDQAAPLLPAGAGAPVLDTDRVGAFTAIFSVEAKDPAAGDRLLTIKSRFAERLQDTLRQAPGTEIVRLYGAADEEILVRVDPERLASLGLDVSAVSRSIAAADSKVSAGRVRGESSDYLLEVEGEITDLARVRAIPIAAEPGGRAVARVGDLAEVLRSERSPPAEIAIANGERVVLVAARSEKDIQVDVWADGVKARVAALAMELPDGLVLRQTFDQSDYTIARLGELGFNLAIGVALVIAVLFVTMGWRQALIVALILPLTTLLTLFVLERIGVVVHQMSVTGLIVALGLLVDAAIVMADEIGKRLSAGFSRSAAVGASVRRLALPLLASTVTTVLAFMPMALLPGPAGDFVGSIAWAVIVMLVSSFGLALTVTPAISGWLLPAGAPGAGPRRATAIGRAYRSALRAGLEVRPLTAALAAAPAIIGFLAFPTLTAQFFPGVDRDQFYIQATLADGAAISETKAVAERIDAALAEIEEIRSVEWVVGRSAPAFYYNMLADRDRAPGFAEALVATTSPAATAALIPVLQARLDALVPQAQVIVRGLVQGPPVAAPLELRLVGPNLEILREFGEEARARMAALASVTHTRADLAGGAPKLVFKLDEDKVRLAGLTLGEVARQLDALLEGAAGGSLIEGSERLPVRVRIDGEGRGAADRILSLPILPPSAPTLAASGAYPGVPLSALGDLALEPSESPIARLDGERVNTVQAFLQLGVLPEEALKALQADLAENPLALPPGYRIEFGGDSDARAEVVRNLMSTVGLVVSLTIASVVLTFNSWRLSMATFVVAGLSMGLSLLALAIFQFPFGIQALIGVIGSIGVSINAALIIMTAMQENPDAAQGDKDAIADVALGSARHIVSTTLTTFGGFLPLILDEGGFWPPFAMSIAGGVLLSTIVSLFFVPPVYSLLVGRPRANAEVRPDPGLDLAREAV